jgi:hypothetical protein
MYACVNIIFSSTAYTYQILRTFFARFSIRGWHTILYKSSHHKAAKSTLSIITSPNQRS